MKIRTIELKRFKRFHDFTVHLPDNVKLVILAGPNGSGKSSLFEAFHFWHRMGINKNPGWDESYYPKVGEPDLSSFPWTKHVTLNFYGTIPSDLESKRKLFYIRSAYRNDPQFELPNLVRQGDPTEEFRFARLIDNDVAVAKNYQRLASRALQDVFALEAATLTLGEFRAKTIGDIRASMKRVFPDLLLNDLGDPLVAGTFHFDKGKSRHFSYKNLSGGEKAAFDLLLDLVVKRRDFNNTVYCIDEPEAHMNTRLQATLLDELVQHLPQESQLWLATHSVGMMRRARDLERKTPGSVAFLDFSQVDFDQPQTLCPARPTRAFWESVLNVALDDLASLVAPARVVVCEGAPSGQQSRNTEHDAYCYNVIFESEFPDTKFLSAGNSLDVESDRLALVAGVRAIASGCIVLRLIDGDDHGSNDIKQFATRGISVLNRRHLESYLYADEVLAALCVKQGKPEQECGLLQDKQDSIAESVARGNPADDLKSASGLIYVKAKQRLSLTGLGNDARAFARNVLAPLITTDMAIYKELRTAIFGPK
jgi:AAA domain, putative AbiEii toxin, Type IV TA system